MKQVTEIIVVEEETTTAITEPKKGKKLKLR
jgi:hypothetical protein